MIDWEVAVLALMTIAALVTLGMSLYWQRHRERYERQDADAYVIMEQALASQQKRYELQTARIDELERQRMGDHEMILELRRRYAALEAYMLRLARQLEANGIVPEPMPDELSRPLAAPVDKRQLAQRIASLFDLDEMATLMFDIGIDDEALTGRTRALRARELVDYAERHGQLDVLAAAVNASRPDSKS